MPDKSKRTLMWTLLIIALVQMPALALTPAINMIQTQAFPDKTLSQVQTAMGMTNLVTPFASLFAAFFINRGRFTKKGVVVTGLVLLGLTGVLALLLHTQFWHIYLLHSVLGVSMGFFMTNAFGLMFDNFNDAERQVIAGYQTSAINGGGIMLGIFGGLLASTMWYGGFLLLLVGLPLAVLAYAVIPSYKSPSAAKGVAEKKKLHPRVYYYAAAAGLFMMLYLVCGTNISTHFHRHVPGMDASALAGIATALQMGGGAFAGIFFGKLSDKLGDKIMAAACGAIFLGYMMIALLASSLVGILAGVFVTGLSLSMMLPRCTYAVSTLVDASTSATATVILSSIAPSIGAFLSPIVLTNATTALFGQSTSARYIFVAGLALAAGIFFLLGAISRDKKAAAGTGPAAIR